MDKLDYILQLATYHKKYMEKKGFKSYKDLMKLNLKEVKEMFRECV